MNNKIEICKVLKYKYILFMMAKYKQNQLSRLSLLHIKQANIFHNAISKLWCIGAWICWMHLSKMSGTSQLLTGHALTHSFCFLFHFSFVFSGEIQWYLHNICILLLDIRLCSPKKISFKLAPFLIPCEINSIIGLVGHD